MTNEASNKKWVWLKGGVFLLLGVVSSTIFILQHPDSLSMVLLLAIVWSFCRAYHTAIYATEHYVDPGFKYMGILSFWDYVFDRHNLTAGTDSQPRYSCDDVARNIYLIKSMALNWIVIATLACIFLPTLFDELMTQLRPKGFTNSRLIGVLPDAANGIGSSLFAGLGVLGALASWSARMRIPVVLTLHLILCSSYYLGFQDPRRAVVSCFVWPGAVFMFTFGMSSMARWLLGWRLVPSCKLASVSSTDRPTSKYGINYLLLLTTLIAICISLVGSIGQMRRVYDEFVEILMRPGLLIAIALVAIALVANSCVRLILAARLASLGKWPFAVYILAIALVPLATMFLTLVIRPPTLGRNIISSLCYAYAFQLGLVVGLATMFTYVRFAQVRLHTREKRMKAEGL